MTTLVQRKPPHQQYNNIYHFALIKNVVLHQLILLNVSWDDFVSHKVFTGPQVPPLVFHEAGEPSHQQEVHETQTTSVPVFFTYQKGTRRLFEVAKRVLSPPGVEGVLFPSSDHRKILSSPRVKGAFPSSSEKQDKGKQPLHDEGPSEGQDKDFILIQD